MNGTARKVGAAKLDLENQNCPTNVIPVFNYKFFAASASIREV
jgi:hypothetical protein